MSADESVIAVVVSDSPALAETVSRASERFPGTTPHLTVVCSERHTANRVDTVATDRPWTASTEVVQPFTVDRIVDVLTSAGADLVVLDPYLDVTPSALRSALSGVDVRVLPPPSGGSGRRRRLWWPTGTAQRATIFVVAFDFYLLLGDPTAFDAVTGLVSAAVVVLLLSHVTFTDAPTARHTPARVARAVVFVPYLLWEIVAANLALAVVLLDPRLPVDPTFETVDAAGASDLERAVLANSISLTPGTLTVDVDGSTLVVHTLTEGSRASLRNGRLERAVRFVFRGRTEAASTP